jgi:long-chain-fatty-acid--CoA ligase ACSBG
VLANCIYTDIYPTNSQEVSVYQASFTEARVIVCDTYKRLKEKFLDSKDFAKLKIKCAILFREGLLPQSAKYSYFNADVKIYNWTQALALGSEIENRIILRKIDNQKPNTCCNIVFTSGTVGESKGVMLSHDNMTWFW